MERCGPTITNAAVRRFEREIGYELPEDYRRFLLEVNGGRTADTHCTFTMHRGARHIKTSLNALLSLDDPDQSRDLATRQLYGQDRLPGTLQIGSDDGGSRIVLVLSGPHGGEVWMLDLEDPRPTGSNPRVEWFDRRDVWKLADSFAEFMASLKPLEVGS
jgi:cell wall assembly regulator SMI1